MWKKSYNSCRNFLIFDFISANSTAKWFWSLFIDADECPVECSLAENFGSLASLPIGVTYVNHFVWYLSRSRAIRTTWSRRWSTLRFSRASLLRTSVCESVTRFIMSTIACCVPTVSSLIRAMKSCLFGHWTAAPSNSVNKSFICSSPALDSIFKKQNV